MPLAQKIIGIFISVVLLAGCSASVEEGDATISAKSNPYDEVSRGALLGTRFQSLDALKEVVDIVYTSASGQNGVIISHSSNGKLVQSALEEGVSQKDFTNARDGGFAERIGLFWRSPYAVMNRLELYKIYNLSRRYYPDYGANDVAFYDLAEAMVCNIDDEDQRRFDERDLGEKGFINTFNHINAQAFMTLLFDEELADFVADVHERYNMPELITGDFTQKQLDDLETGPVDNYVDMINNEWGQEIGKQLSHLNPPKGEEWTEDRLVQVLNKLQSYYAWSFGIRFRPFRETDMVVKLFVGKLNVVLFEKDKIKF